jgi:hypothetical protein
VVIVPVVDAVGLVLPETQPQEPVGVMAVRVVNFFRLITRQLEAAVVFSVRQQQAQATEITLSIIL